MTDGWADGGAVVHPRVSQRHPELSEADVLAAWDACIAHVMRLDLDRCECLAVGCDTRGRLVEMVAAESRGGGWVIYHAFTPPTRKELRELGMLGRSR